MNESRPTVQRDFSVLGDWLSEIFRLWSKNMSVWILQGLIFFCISVLTGAIFYFISFTSIMVATSIFDNGMPDSFTIGFIIIMYALVIFCGLFAICLYPGMLRSAIKQLRGQEISVRDLFSGIRYGWGYFVVSFCGGIGVLACGFGLFLIHGLLFLSLPLMLDKGYSTMQAVSASWDTCKQNFWLYVLYAFVVLLLGSIGVLACYVGLIITIPFLAIGQAIAYERTYNPTAQPVTSDSSI